VLLQIAQIAAAHPMPNSVVGLSFNDNTINLKIEVPIQEFELAFGKNLLSNPDNILPKYEKEIKDYFFSHLKIKSLKGVGQKLKLNNIKVNKTAYSFGEYLELIVEISCITSNEFNNRDFYLYYDAITHQVANHFTVIKINRDFNNGITPEDTLQFAVIELDRESNTIKPLHIILENGSKWKGLKKMITLGMHHIAGGLDHLLFILMLIIISPLLIENNRWINFGGWRYTLFRLLKIITSFTIGHTITLCIFSFFTFNTYSKWIEIAIAVTILFTAIHCIKPIVKTKEIYITFFFGLIHGSAFGITLNEWALTTNQKFLSLLGFNLGIEIMQLIIVVVSIPILYSSKFTSYKLVRVSIATITIIISFLWIIERFQNKTNLITEYLNKIF
jgi:hydrogenase/urease accessory protein HupE